MTALQKVFRVTGGFMKGICHPENYAAEAKRMGIDWVRVDMPYPVNPDGSFSDGFYRFGKQCREMASIGVRTIGITNYGREFAEHGINIRSADGLAQIEAICARAAEALGADVPVWQIGNEVNLTHMRAPLTREEGKNVLIASMKGVRAGNPDAVVGHNSYGGSGCSFGEDWLDECKEIEEKTGGSDYIGLDLYACSWTDGPCTVFTERIDEIWELFGLPVILMEFGFPSSGVSMPQKAGAVDRWLQKRGIPSVRAAYGDIDAFLSVLTKPRLLELGRSYPGKDRDAIVLPLLQHEAEGWFAESEFPHTEDGQADFYDRLLPMLLCHPHLAGAVLYAMQDDPKCYFCGSETCCCETAWGILHKDGSPKKCAEVIRRHFLSEQ